MAYDDMQVAVVSVLSSVFIALGGTGVARAADTQDIASAVFYNCLVYTAYPGEQRTIEIKPADETSTNEMSNDFPRHT